MKFVRDSVKRSASKRLDCGGGLQQSERRSQSAATLNLFRYRLVMQQIRDAAHEAWQIERLGEKIVRLHRHRAPGDFTRERAHENHGDFFCGRLAAQDFADGQAVEVGQQDVEEDQIRLELPRLTQRLHAVVGHDEVVALPREFVLQQLDEIVLVIHQQNPVRHAAKLAGFAPTTTTARLK